MTFRSPHVWADALLLVVVFPIAIAALAFLLLLLIVPLSILAGAGDSQWPTIAAVTAAATIAIAVARRKLFWSIALESDGLRIGTWRPRRVAYDKIRYISAGRSTAPLEAVGRTASERPVPFVFSTGILRQQRLFLSPKDASVCLRELHARCPNAAALDADGTILPPHNPGALPYTQFRLAETLALRAAAAWATALVGLAVLVVPVAGSGDPWQDLRNRLRVSSAAWLILPAVPALIAYGMKNVRDLRRVLTFRR